MKTRVGVVSQEAIMLASLENGACGERASPVHLTNQLLLLWEDVRLVRGLGSFNLAFALLANLSFCLLSLRTRFLILLANGIIKTLFQLGLSGLETVYAKVLCEYRRAKQ
jgi:hypothetical protein